MRAGASARGNPSETQLGSPRSQAARTACGGRRRAGARPPALTPPQPLAPAHAHASCVPERAGGHFSPRGDPPSRGKGEGGPTTPAPRASGYRESSLGAAKLFASDSPVVQITDSDTCVCQRTGIETVERKSPPDPKRNRRNTRYVLKEERFEQVFHRGNGSLRTPINT